MKFVPSLELIKQAASDGYAVPSFCVWSAETMETVLRVAQDMQAPVMLMNGPGEFPLLDPAAMGAIAQGIATKYNVPAALHLDHGDSRDQVTACLKAGYTSVMLDFSTRSFEENASALKWVADVARPYGATVEGEIGSVGKIDEISGEGGEVAALTDPAEAVKYVEQTGVDLLAIAIGNAHGNYTVLPKLDFERLGKINRMIEIPLVLHGGSGTPDEDLKHAISLGIAKVNVASELIRTVRESVHTQWNAKENLWVPAAFVPAMEEMAKVVEKWIKRLGAAGKA